MIADPHCPSHPICLLQVGTSLETSTTGHGSTVTHLPIVSPALMSFSPSTFLWLCVCFDFVSLCSCSLSLGLFFSLSVSFCLCHPHHYQCPAGQGNWWPLRSTHVPIRQVRSFLLRRSIGYSSPRAPPRAKNILICFQSSFGKLRLHLPFQRLLTYRPSPSLYTCRHPISPSALGHGQCRCTLLSAWKPLPPYSPATAPCGISWTLMGLLLRHSGQ